MFSSRNAFSILVIIANIAVFLLQARTPAITSEYGLSQANFQEMPWTTITSGFLHADGTHLAMNMIAVFFLMSGGWETMFGSVRYAIIYFASLLGGSAAVLMWSDPNTLTVGASGAIYGLMGALIGGILRAHKNFSDLGSMLVPIIGYIAINLGLTLTNPIISWQAHVGGLVVGFVVALILGVRSPEQDKPERQRKKVQPHESY